MLFGSRVLRHSFFAPHRKKIIFFKDLRAPPMPRNRKKFGKKIFNFYFFPSSDDTVRSCKCFFKHFGQFFIICCSNGRKLQIRLSRKLICVSNKQIGLLLSSFKLHFILKKKFFLFLLPTWENEGYKFENEKNVKNKIFIFIFFPPSYKTIWLRNPENQTIKKASPK